MGMLNVYEDLIDGIIWNIHNQLGYDGIFIYIYIYVYIYIHIIIYYNITWEWHLAILRCWGLGVCSSPLHQNLGPQLKLWVHIYNIYNIYILTIVIGVVSQMIEVITMIFSPLTTPTAPQKRIDFQLEVATGSRTSSRTSPAWHGRCKAWDVDGWDVDQSPPPDVPRSSHPIGVLSALNIIDPSRYSELNFPRGCPGKVPHFETNNYFLGASTGAQG